MATYNLAYRLYDDLVEHKWAYLIKNLIDSFEEPLKESILRIPTRSIDIESVLSNDWFDDRCLTQGIHQEVVFYKRTGETGNLIKSLQNQIEDTVLRNTYKPGTGDSFFKQQAASIGLKPHEYRKKLIKRGLLPNLKGIRPVLYYEVNHSTGMSVYEPWPPWEIDELRFEIETVGIDPDACECSFQTGHGLRHSHFNLLRYWK